jgi:hypothetical protein
MLLGRDGATVNVIGQPIYRPARYPLPGVDRPAHGVTASVEGEQARMEPEGSNGGLVARLAANERVGVGGDDDVGARWYAVGAEFVGGNPRNPGALGYGTQPIREPSAAGRYGTGVRGSDHGQHIVTRSTDHAENICSELLLPADQNSHVP